MVVAGFAAAVLATGVVHAAQPIPIEALSRLPAIQSVSMDPDGKHLVGLIVSPDNPDETALATWDTAKFPSAPAVITPSGSAMKFIAAEALKAGKILAVARQAFTGNTMGCIEGQSIGSTRTFVTRVYLTGDDQKHFAEAFASGRSNINTPKQVERCLELAGSTALVDRLPLDPDHVIIVRATAGETGNYYRYNLKTGRADLLFKGDPRTVPELFDPRTGELLVERQIPIGDKEIQTWIRDPKSGQFVSQPPLTVEVANRYTMDVIGVDAASGKYYVKTNKFSSLTDIRLYDAAARKFDPQPVLAAKDFPIEGLVFGNQPVDFNKVVGYTVAGPALETVYIEPHLKGVQQSLEKIYPGQQVGLLSYTNDFNRVLFKTANASHPPAWHLLVDQKNIADVGSSRPWITPDEIGTERWVTYKARDGLEIPAILDLPAAWKQGDAPLPAVVMPHGGPWARDFMGWDESGWTPLLTSRGYVVLRPQYRGSAGLGRKLWLAGDNQWGLKMSDDLDDGAAWLVSQGIAQKDRIAIYGYSYGGFAAVAADVRSPSPFQCAIAGAPVANLARLKTVWSADRLQRILQGHTITGMNPMANTGKAHLPILLFNGDRDVRVPPSWNADAFYNAVKGIVPARHVVIPDMPHSLPWSPGQMKQVDELVVDYLANGCFTRRGTAASARGK